jgi:hypothetical protein
VFQLHFFLNHIIDFKKIVQQKHIPFMKVHVHWVDLMKNQIIKKFQSLEILKERATNQKDSFFNHLAKTIVQWVQNV